MQKELSLKKITELWQNTSFGTNFYENDTELSDATFNLSIDENGRGFFFFTDKKGHRLGTDEILSDGTPLGLAISRLKNQGANRIFWESDEDSAIYLDENSEFTYQLFKGERSFLFNGSIISNAMENERSRIALNVGETEDFKKFTTKDRVEKLNPKFYKGDKSMQIFLEPFCVHLSSTLYKAAPQKLIKYCRSRDDVKMIFDTLGFRAKNDIPKIWKNLQDELLSSFVAIKPETDWTIISLEKN